MIQAATDMLFKTIRTTWASLPSAGKAVSAILAAWDGIAWLFIGLKLSGVITWSWWWVSAPIWGFVAVAALMAALMAAWLAILFLLVVALMAKNPDRHVSL